MLESPFWLAPLLAALATWSLTPLVRRYLVTRQIIDHPNHRSSHRQATPRGGGLAMAAGLMLAVVSAVPADQIAMLLVVILALTVLGWLDDRHDLPVSVRLLVQLLLAVGMLVWLGGVKVLSVAGVSITLPWLWSGLALIAVVWLINLHNFMDGSDGLAAMQGAWSGLAFGVLFAYAEQRSEAMVAFSLAAVCLAFLFWNRPPARLFMGDVGSVLLGGMIAWLALVGVVRGAISVWLSLMVCAVFVVDASLTLLARVRRGERWYTAHRQHAYQRLINAGWGHGRVLAMYTGVNAVVVLPALVIGVALPGWDFWLALVVSVLLAAGWWAIQSAANGELESHD
jgi:Fuc2NAc and GlcNAc transferase